MKQSPVSPKSQRKIVTQLKSLSYLLDESINIPGTKYRLGIDPLLGLLPVAGDYLGAIFAGYIVFQSARLGISKATLLRMTANILIETVVGVIPLLGDIFDVTWKANKKNIELLNIHLYQPEKSQKADLWFVIFLLSIVFFVLILITLITFTVVKFLWTVFWAN